MTNLGLGFWRLDYPGPFERPVHISFSELREMVTQAGSPYRIYRVFEAGPAGGKLRISGDLGGSPKLFSRPLARLPAGTAVDAISVDPAGISFGHEIALAPAEESDEP